MNEERLVEIETKITFQEQAIKELNDVIYKQQKEIDKVVSVCDTLVKRINEISEITSVIGEPANEKPPHY